MAYDDLSWFMMFYANYSFMYVLYIPSDVDLAPRKPCEYGALVS